MRISKAKPQTPNQKWMLLFAAAVGASLALQCNLALAGPFELFVTQSPPGPQNQDPATWGGVLQYHLDSSGATLIPGAGIDRTNLADPAGLAFRVSSSELFVGNRHGNNNPSSISRFIYDSVTRRLTPNGTITGNGLYGVHQIAFNPVTGEMFAANVNSGVSRFTFDSSGNAVANGTISSGAARGVAVAPDGKRLYVTGASSTIRQFDLLTGAELATVTVPAASGGLHYFELRSGHLYVAALYADLVYRYAIDTNDDLVLVDSISMNDPAAIAFNPDGQEMFVSGHRTSDIIYRFKYVPQSDTWTEEATFDAQSSLGSILTIPSGPQLAIAPTPTNSIVVSWSLPAQGWVLQESQSLIGNPPVWTEIVPPYKTNSAQAWITVPAPTGVKFYRLSHP